MTESPAVSVRPVKYEVSALPEGSPSARYFTIDVEYQGQGLWAVARFDSCLGSDGTWAEGVKPYDRGQKWLDEHRYDLDTALKLARDTAPHLVVEGRTVADVLVTEEAEGGA
ncbi:hypothetical protein ACOKM5_44285 [Streptomyces sp. BH097]|uniref:hypothetical protein n=1 Tax=Streptomyces sp. BH097 TaxID=3410406 RepID=UPI003CEA59E6